MALCAIAVPANAATPSSVAPPPTSGGCGVYISAFSTTGSQVYATFTEECDSGVIGSMWLAGFIESSGHTYEPNGINCTSTNSSNKIYSCRETVYAPNPAGTQTFVAGEDGEGTHINWVGTYNIHPSEGCPSLGCQNLTYYR